MKKNSIGELKLSPIKDEGKFVFYNDFITINGKVSKGDKVMIFIDRYDMRNGQYHIDPASEASAVMIIRGKQFRENGLLGHNTLDSLYDHVASLYKDKFYFGNKV